MLPFKDQIHKLLSKNCISTSKQVSFFLYAIKNEIIDGFEHLNLIKHQDHIIEKDIEEAIA